MGSKTPSGRSSRGLYCPGSSTGPAQKQAAKRSESCVGRTSGVLHTRGTERPEARTLPLKIWSWGDRREEGQRACLVRFRPARERQDKRDPKRRLHGFGETSDGFASVLFPGVPPDL
ncbi:uncharacterized protein LOC144576644 isoform X2 [Callithrix jacchus]